MHCSLRMHCQNRNPFLPFIWLYLTIPAICRMNTLIIAILILYLYDGNFIHAKRHDSITPMILYTALLQRYAFFSCSFNGLLPFCTGDNQIIMPHMIHRCTIQNILPFHKTYAFQIQLSEIMQYVLMI